MRFSEIKPQLNESAITPAAKELVRSAIVKAVGNSVKFLKGGPNQIYWDIAALVFIPSYRESVWKHIVEKDAVGIALDILTLRGNVYSIMAAIMAQIARDSYDSIFINGTPDELKGTIPGDIPTLKGHLESVAVSNPAVAAARTKTALAITWELFKDSVSDAYNEFGRQKQAELIRMAGQDDADFSGTRISQPAFGNPNLANQGRAAARNKLANQEFELTPSKKK